MVMVLHKFALLGGKVPAATGMRAAGRPENPAPTGRSSFRLVFMGRCSLFAAYVFSQDFALFAAGTERIARPPQGQGNGIVFIHPRRLSILGLCGGEEWSPSPQGQANGSILSTLVACRFWAFAVGKNGSHPRKGKANGWVFYPLLPGSANCGVKSSPSRRRASSRAGCGGRAVK